MEQRKCPSCGQAWYSAAVQEDWTCSKCGAKLKANDKPGYICNPLKNVTCTKISCVHNPNSRFKLCDKTSNPAYAVLDSDGDPIRVFQPEDYIRLG